MILSLSGIFYFPWLHFKKIIISGNSHIDEKIIIQKLIAINLNGILSKYLGYDNMLIWNKTNISDPLIDNLTIERHWLDRTMEVRGEEKKRYAVWCLKIDCFWITENGQVLEKAPQSQGQLVNIINSNQDINIKIGDQVLSIKEFSYLKNIIDSLSNLNISIENIDYDIQTLELTVKTDAGQKLLFSLHFDPSLIISTIGEVISKKETQQTKYIDFRTENKVYYKKL